MNNVLIIAYYFPPAGGPGVQRWLKFVKYLRLYGWDSTVISVKDVLELGQSGTIDTSLLDEVPREATVIRTESLDPFRLLEIVCRRQKQRGSGQASAAGGYVISSLRIHSTLKWFQRFFCFPDSRFLWLPFAVSAASKEISSKGIRVVCTTSPPVTAAAVGLVLKKRFGVSWILDMRDLWLEDPFTIFASKFHQLLAAKTERVILEEADMIAVVSSKARDIVAAKVRNPEKVTVIPNGYDPEDFSSVSPITSNQFTIVYCGSIHSHNLRPFLTFLDAVRTVKTRGAVLKVRFVGRVPSECFDAVKARKLERDIEFTGYVEHRISVAHLLGANVALLLVDSNTPGAETMVTGKVFEYLGSGVPILAIVPAEGEAASLIREADAGVVVRDDPMEVASQIEALVRHPLRKVPPNERAVQFSRKYQSAVLASMLDRMAPKNL